MVAPAMLDPTRANTTNAVADLNQPDLAGADPVRVGVAASVPDGEELAAGVLGLVLLPLAA